MSNSSKRVLLWAPRVLSMAYIAFLSIFALDVFGEQLGLWKTALALIMHLAFPCFLLLAALILAWRREWIGAVVFTIWGLFYVITTAAAANPWTSEMRLNLALGIGGPAFLIAVLFLIDWFKHGELRTTG
jgi:hypothetical protein